MPESPTTVYAWKFVVPTHEFRKDPEDPNLEFKGFVTVVLATTEEGARSKARSWASEMGFDSRWLRAADVKRLDLVAPSVLCWVEA